VEDGVDVVLLQAVHHLVRVGDVAMVEGEVLLVFEGPGVIEGGAVVELVEGDDIVCIGVSQCEMSYQPARAAPRVSKGLWDGGGVCRHAGKLATQAIGRLT